MSETNRLDYEKAASTLMANSLAVSPAELHGLLSGMLCGGMSPEGTDWLPMLYDFTNEGMGWPEAPREMAISCFDTLVESLNDDSLGFAMWLPENAGVIEHAEALSEWVNTFMAGLGLAGIKIGELSAESKEALEDLREIAQLGVDEDDDMEEQANLLEQVAEHVRMCALVLHAELGKKLKTDESRTLH